jgi:hypothetical protein
MSLIAAVPVSAQNHGVFVDPDSPSGKEYALPLDAARRQADPRRDPAARVRTNSRSTALFGQGVVSPISGHARAAVDARKKNRSNPARHAPVSTDSLEDREAVRLATIRPGAPDGNAGTKLLIAAVALLVLAVGGVAGYATRRRVRDS